MAAPAMLCAGMEIALNGHLALEAEALAQCAALQNQVIELHTESPDWSFFLEFHPGGVRVLNACARKPDVRVSSALRTLFQLLMNAARGDEQIPPGLKVEGDVAPLQRFARALARAGFDAEEFAARFVGEAMAHRAVSGLRGLLGWSRHSMAILGTDTAEYLREETRDLARGADVYEWAGEVDQMRDAVETLDARLRRLEARTRP
ncbi:SCP2 domain-containing protein [Sinimarinibacterium sp. NLF-5-8]|uniref:ubiquinone biosynthesis accessory factor UbiJ n=1 Tax=Sinimarinibacterium sp. NLF-5-8 TaxID=2698684 RepID=UPI00137C2920|nr:SCP2 sterol-binding domain-containing protein [Sinimarinibacterium sp. NLF-5-8]QHS10491.1 hypothetical protein GT972_10365 [Sinimarinibacterium sp. NLF-5-8]